MNTIQYYKIQVCIDLPGDLDRQGYGYWQPWFKKKYQSLRRAQQALPFAKSQWSSVSFRIVACPPPTSQQVRATLGLPSYDWNESLTEVLLAAAAPSLKGVAETQTF